MSLRLTDLARLVVCPPSLTSSAEDVISIHLHLLSDPKGIFFF